MKKNPPLFTCNALFLLSIFWVVLFSVISTVISYAEVVTSGRHHCNRKVFFSNKAALKLKKKQPTQTKNQQPPKKIKQKNPEDSTWEEIRESEVEKVTKTWWDWGEERIKCYLSLKKKKKSLIHFHILHGRRTSVWSSVGGTYHQVIQDWQLWTAPTVSIRGWSNSLITDWWIWEW